ncbi:MAG: J domain-containing protein [Oligosphaeraceae bacterium]
MPRRLPPSGSSSGRSRPLALSPETLRRQALFQRLSTRYGELLEQYARMRDHEGKALQAKYLGLFGQREYRLYLLQVECLRMRRKISLLQAAVNRGDPPRPQEAEAILEKEFALYQKELQQRWEELAKAEALLHSPTLTEEESAEFRTLYRTLAKKLHPDLHPHLPEEAAALWNRIQEAYRNGDLPALRLLGEYTDYLLENTPRQEEPPPLPSAWEARINSLKGKMRKLEEAMETLSQRPPLSYRPLLEDQERCRERQQELDTLIQQQENLKAELTAYLRRFLEE